MPRGGAAETSATDISPSCSVHQPKRPMCRPPTETRETARGGASAGILSRTPNCTVSGRRLAGLRLRTDAAANTGATYIQRKQTDTHMFPSLSSFLKIRSSSKSLRSDTVTARRRAALLPASDLARTSLGGMLPCTVESFVIYRRSSGGQQAAWMVSACKARSRLASHRLQMQQSDGS